MSSSRRSGKFVKIEDADWIELPCGECGHAQMDHLTWTYVVDIGGVLPAYCSRQGCDCKAYRPKRLKDKDR